MTLVLSRDEIRGLLQMPDVIETVESAHAAHAAGDVAQPTRITVPLAGSPNAILPMAATIREPPAAGLKLLAIFPPNRGTPIPVLNAVVVLVDSATGRCSAILEGGVLTAFRTAAASAVATRCLARKDVRTLGLVGAGIEARTHLAAIRCVRPTIERVLVWSRERATAERFAADMADHDVEIVIADTPEAATRGADVLCTLTPAKEPIVHGAWFAPGLHVNAVGTHWIDFREIDTEAVTRSRVVVDSRDANAAECGDLMIPVAERAITPDHFADELGQLINGDRPGRTSPEEITMYQSVGVAIQDVATAGLLVRLALDQGVGTQVELW
jgi:ornithine cyclodeaminase/alanine dehydrogenase